MRIGLKTLAWLGLCAAAISAALAHMAIDVAGDYLIARDSYDHLAHGSRDLMTGLAVLAACILARRGLRACFRIAAIDRTRLAGPRLRGRHGLVLFAGAAAGSLALVPAMEWFDGALAGAPVNGLANAFGGSLALGAMTTLLCATVVALVAYAVVRWLISHRDVIATLIETLLRPDAGEGAGHASLHLQRSAPRRRTPRAHRLAKRGPPITSFA